MYRLATAFRCLAVTACLLVQNACQQHTIADNQAMNPQVLDDALTRIAAARILFLHQSIGENLLDGMQFLAQERGVSLRVVSLDAWRDAGAGIFHARAGKNREPDTKYQAWLAQVDAAAYESFDVAAFKLCFVDLGPDAELHPDVLLGRYQKTLSKLSQQHPRLRILPITIPLEAPPAGKKSWVWRRLQRPLVTDPANVLRHRFNQALRQQFAGQPLFDLAASESTRPDGTRYTFPAAGEDIPQLLPQYTVDGAHLNTAGQRMAAAAFILSLADILRP